MRFPKENWYKLLSSSYQACILALKGGDWASVLPKPSVGVGKPNYYVRPNGRNSTWKDERLSVSKIGSGGSRSHSILNRSSALYPHHLAMGKPANLKHTNEYFQQQTHPAQEWTSSGSSNISPVEKDTMPVVDSLSGYITRPFSEDQVSRDNDNIYLSRLTPWFFHKRIGSRSHVIDADNTASE